MNTIDLIEDRDDELPENFFEDFENNDFLDELVENVAMDEETEGAPESGEEKSNRRSRSSSPIVNRCLEEIDKLTQEIRRRKRRLQQELSANDGASRTSEIETPTSTTEIDKLERRSRRHTARRSRSPRRRSRESHNTQNNRPRIDIRRTIPNSRIRRRSRSRSRSRNRNQRVRSRERDREPRRPRSGSPPRKTHRRAVSPPSSQISFLEELERTFAKQGKTFPEKELLLRITNQSKDVPPNDYPSIVPALNDYPSIVPPPNDYQSPDVVPLFFNELNTFQHSGASQYVQRQPNNALLPTPGQYQEVFQTPIYRNDVYFLLNIKKKMF